MSQQPLPLENEIIKKLNEFTLLGSTNDIELQAVKKEINKVPDITTKNRLLGIFFAVKKDISNVMKHFQLALNCSGSSQRKA